MYSRWLQLFFSPITEIPVKGRKEKQKLEKSWVDDGSLKLAGSKPSAWSIILKPSYSVDIRTYLFHIDREKDKSLNMMKQAFETRDDKLFRDAEQRYQAEEQKKKKIDEILEENKVKEILMAEQLFQARRSLYLFNRKRRDNPKDFTDKDKKALEKMNHEVRELTKSQIKEKRDIMMRVRQYTAEVSSIQQQGPYPIPPEVTALPAGARRRQVIVGVGDQEEEDTESEEEEPEKDEVNEEQNDNQEGGNIRIIKLY